MWSRSIARHALALGSLAAMLGVVGCNVLLGIDGDDYRDVAVELCGCPGVSERYEDCQSRVRDILANASPEARESWLGTFESLDCASCPDERTVNQCLLSKPLCVDPGGECRNELDCCGAIDRDGSVYCHQGKCVAEAQGCVNSFGECTAEADCCGSEINSLPNAMYATCGVDDNLPTRKVCYERCAEENANCPGCCGRVDIGLTGVQVCLDGTDTAVFFNRFVATGSTFCESLCTIGESGSACPEGRRCELLRLGVATSLHFCAPPPCGPGLDPCPAGTVCDQREGVTGNYCLSP